MNESLLIFDQKGHLTIFSLNVHMNENYLATILYLIEVKRISVMRVTMYISLEKDMNMILRYGTVLKFE